MNNLDTAQFADLMAALAEVFDDGRTLSPLKVEIYFQALGRFEISEIKSAISRMIQTRTYGSFPKPAEIIQEIQGRLEDQALLAWTAVEKAIRHLGPYPSVKFEDPLIHSVVDSLGGWAEFQDFKVTEWTWRQKEFLARYNAMGRRREHPEYLPGIAEVQNLSRGFTGFIPKPVLILHQNGKVRMIEASKERGHLVPERSSS